MVNISVKEKKKGKRLKKPGNVNFFTFMIAGLLKPMTALKENLPKFSNIKNSIIFTVIITVISTILLLITAIYTTVREQSCTGGLFF